MSCFDIHTHHLPLQPERTIVSCSVEALPFDNRVVHASVGIHPWILTGQNKNTFLLSLQNSLSDDRVVAMGEVGLDRLRGCSLDVQTSVFRHEIALAEEYRLPVVIHCVRAFNELLQLKKECRPTQPWIIHGFRGKESVAKELLRHGFYLSFGAHFQEEALRVVPLERLFVETDEADESIENIYRRIAEVRGIGCEELQECINKNVDEVFFKR